MASSVAWMASMVPARPAPASLPGHITKRPAQAQEGFLLSEQATPRKSDRVEPRQEGQLLPARTSATLG